MRGSAARAAFSTASAISPRSASERSSIPGSAMSRSMLGTTSVAMRRSSSGSVIFAIRRACSTHAWIPISARSLVCAKPMRCASSTRTPRPRSPREMTLSMPPSFVSTEPDCASRRNTSPPRTPPLRRAASARSTTSSLLRRSLMLDLSASPRRHVPGGLSRSSRTLASLAERGPLPPSRSSLVLSLELAADDDRRDAQGRLRVGDRRALAILAARAGGVAEVPADHVDLTHEFRSLADERRAAQRLSELAVADAVALGDLEGEVAAHHVDLSAAHLLHEDAVLHRAHDVVRVGFARRDHRVRHPADGEMAEALAACVAAPRDAQLRGVLSIREVRLQNAPLDEDGPLRRRALVVDRRRAALARIAAVVDDGDELARDLLPAAARVHRETLQVQIGLETVADGFVDERAAGFAGEHDRVRPGGRRLGADVQHGARRRRRGGLGDHVVVQHLEAARAADRLEARLEHVAVPSYDVYREVGAYARVRPVQALAGRDEHVLHALGVHDGDLADTRVVGAGDFVRAAQQRHLALHRDGPRVDRYRMWARKLVGSEAGRLVQAGPVDDTACRTTGDGHDVVDVGDVPVRIDHAFPMHDADTGSLVDTGDRIFDVPIVEDELERLVALPEDLRPLAASRERRAQRPPERRRRDHRGTRDRQRGTDASLPTTRASADEWYDGQSPITVTVAPRSRGPSNSAK